MLAAVLVVGGLAGVVGLCAVPVGKGIQLVGALVTAASPMNLLWAIVYPAATVPRSMTDPVAGRVTMIFGALLAAGGYAALVYAMHTTMKRSFMFTVRKLAGTN